MMTLDEAIIKKAIKLGKNRDGAFIKYKGKIYWINIKDNIIVEQKTKK